MMLFLPELSGYRPRARQKFLFSALLVVFSISFFNIILAKATSHLGVTLHRITACHSITPVLLEKSICLKVDVIGALSSAALFSIILWSYCQWREDFATFAKQDCPGTSQ